jgi:hypothetical protein
VGKTNMTLTIDSDLLIEVRELAARRHTTVSGLAGEHLRLLVELDHRRHGAWQSVRRLVERPKARVGGRLPARGELHGRSS